MLRPFFVATGRTPAVAATADELLDDLLDGTADCTSSHELVRDGDPSATR